VEKGRVAARAISGLALILTLAVIALGTGEVRAHCEIPCGIYDHQLRADLIAEHSTTIEKSMKKIVELSKQNPVNYNQLVFWVSDGRNELV
jgi:nickel superoxide dismutase